MLYVDLDINKEDMLSDRERKMPSIIRNLIYFFRKTIGQVLKYKINGKYIIVLSEINRRSLKKLDKIFKIDVTKNICISNNLIVKEDFVKYLNNRNLNILDGRWLFKYLIEDIVEYICKNAFMLSEMQEITILSNENSILICESIKRLSNKVRNINIVTKDIRKFKKLEKIVYEEKGLIINVTNNYKKAVSKSNIILNLDFVQEEFNKIVFPKKSIIVNFESGINILSKSFNGINASFYHINLPIKYKEMFANLNNFSTVCLYESIIYKKTSVQNIWKEIKEDGIKIECLEGNNGNMVRFLEYYKNKQENKLSNIS